MLLLEIRRLLGCSRPARRLARRRSLRARTDFQHVCPELLLRGRRCELGAGLARAFSVDLRSKSSPEEDSRRMCRTRVLRGDNLLHEVLKARVSPSTWRLPGL